MRPGDSAITVHFVVTLVTGPEAIQREVGLFLARLDAASDADLDRPTPCRGWKVSDLARHVAWGQSLQAEALGRAVTGHTEAASAHEPEATTRGELIAEIRSRHDRLAETLARLSDGDLERPCPLPYATVPTMFALQIFTMEAGVHGHDLCAAFETADALAPDVVEATATVVTATLPFFAAAASETPPTTARYRLRSPRLDVLCTFRDGSWQVGSGDGQPDCEVSGDDSAVLLFALGRVGTTGPGISIAGDPDLAARFKTYFPGP